MYCIKCGVKLADTEEKCPLCNTTVYHPEIDKKQAPPLYPSGKMPKGSSSSKVICGAVIILFLFPAIVCFLADFQINHTINWSGYVLGALLIAYVAFALPMWFKKPNPVIFTPCTFAAIILYLSYVNFATGGNWFLSFALPITSALCLIVCALVTLLHYLRHGKLYVIGGFFILFGGLITLIEFLLDLTFSLDFIGWSFYPLAVLFLVGALLIYLAINRSARAAFERKLFF
jgi:hypothetical protein